ncbi:hypothetical protein GTW51_05110 [Aurantimonas aggregata]|uniref:Uncharacterized protein n=1 Tax=Aurantimonas aggregata TaxID=2047720 RepID=A0A6L9ME25_9HYPH|nr:hypothetical protein [Aurantimonas aggregata]NDV86079.1 hypothetical protein [Aurantimonas aggregata]
MPELLRFLLRNALIGFAAAAFFVSALALADIGRFGTVLRASDIGLLAFALLVYLLGLTFAGVQIGFALMLGHATPDDDRREKRLRKRWSDRDR